MLRRPSRGGLTLVELRTKAQAVRVAEATSGTQLPSTADEGHMSIRVRLPGDFEVHRAMVESVSVLFRLYEERHGKLVEVPSGWSLRGTTFEVDWPANRRVVRSHFGARRFAYNWARALVGADLDARATDSEHECVAWSLAGLRKAWNAEKDSVAPWWSANSKEAYSSGIADLVVALDNWKASTAGTRSGAKVGFPRFRAKGHDRARVRFTTGAMRVEPDRRTITLPVIGPLRCKENTRRLERHLARGNARVLNMTLSERWGRLFVSVSYAIRTPPVRPPAKPGVRAGVDLGLRTLATVAITEGELIEVPNPAPLRATLSERRRVGRQMSRRIPGSNGHRAAKAKLARLDRRTVGLRRKAWHQLTTKLAGTYSEIVIEDLDLAAMKQSMGRRAFRRSVSDAAMGQFRPMLTYKTARAGTTRVVADRWFASSQIHDGCGCQLVAIHKMDKYLGCAVTGELVDRDANAAKNLRDWPDHASCGSVGATAPVVSRSAGSGGDAGSDAEVTRRRGSGRKTGASSRPPAVRPEPTPAGAGGGTLRGVLTRTSTAQADRR